MTLTLLATLAGVVPASHGASPARPAATTLKQAFADIRAALDDVTQFRQAALPQMAQAIIELDQLSAEAGRTIENLDNARKVGVVLNKQLGQPE
jgi:hypothetical protein